MRIIIMGKLEYLTAGPVPSGLELVTPGGISCLALEGFRVDRAGSHGTVNAPGGDRRGLVLLQTRYAHGLAHCSPWELR